MFRLSDPKLEVPIFKREILCAFNVYDMITKRYPNRKVYPEMHLKHDEFAYFGLGGHVRMVKVKDWSIWVCDEDAGWPYMKRVR